MKNQNYLDRHYFIKHVLLYSASIFYFFKPLTFGKLHFKRNKTQYALNQIKTFIFSQNAFCVHWKIHEIFRKLTTRMRHRRGGSADMNTQQVYVIGCIPTTTTTTTNAKTMKINNHYYYYYYSAYTSHAFKTYVKRTCAMNVYLQQQHSILKKYLGDSSMKMITHISKKKRVPI